MTVSISREEFVEEAKKLSEGDYLDYDDAVEMGMEASNEYRQTYSRYYSPSKEETSQYKTFLSQFLVESVYKGGMSGGSCWDEGPHENYYAESGNKIEFGLLDKFLAKVAPEITFLKYRGISDLVKEEDKTEYQYYGNTSDYKIFWINLNDLYDYLSEES